MAQDSLHCDFQIAYVRPSGTALGGVPSFSAHLGVLRRAVYQSQHKVHNFAVTTVTRAESYDGSFKGQPLPRSYFCTCFSGMAWLERQSNWLSSVSASRLLAWSDVRRHRAHSHSEVSRFHSISCTLTANPATPLSTRPEAQIRTVNADVGGFFPVKPALRAVEPAVISFGQPFTSPEKDSFPSFTLFP